MPGTRLTLTAMALERIIEIAFPGHCTCDPVTNFGISVTNIWLARSKFTHIQISSPAPVSCDGVHCWGTSWCSLKIQKDIYFVKLKPHQPFLRAFCKMWQSCPMHVGMVIFYLKKNDLWHSGNIISQNYSNSSPWLCIIANRTKAEKNNKL